MKDDYLWDKSGEPDPQIQELEEILAPLRYQPKPLELPDNVRRRNYYVPLLAIAAMLRAGITASNIQPHHSAANRRPEGYVDLVFEVGAGLGTFLCGAAASAEDAGKNIAEAART